MSSTPLHHSRWHRYITFLQFTSSSSNNGYFSFSSNHTSLPCKWDIGKRIADIQTESIYQSASWWHWFYRTTVSSISCIVSLSFPCQPPEGCTSIWTLGCIHVSLRFYLFYWRLFSHLSRILVDQGEFDKGIFLLLNESRIQVSKVRLKLTFSV
jgi:hypothetical protein